MPRRWGSRWWKNWFEACFPLAVAVPGDALRAERQANTWVTQRVAEDGDG
jgi:hypothetical protein